MRRLFPAALTGLLLALPMPRALRAADAIPQDPKRQEALYHDLLEWNRATLGGAYEQAGRKSPKWDGPAREALEAAARLFGRAIDPCVREEQVFAVAKKAVGAGCDDPLVLDLYARTSRFANNPGPVEVERRWRAAAAAMEPSAYPPIRRALTLEQAGRVRLDKQAPAPDDRKEAERLFDAALALAAKNAPRDDRSREAKDEWFELTKRLIDDFRKLTNDFPRAFERVDAALAKAPDLKAMRLTLKGDYLTRYAWEARGIGLANTVTEPGKNLFGERLIEAYKTLTQAWAVEPSGARIPNLMLQLDKGLGAPRGEMEKWFQRALVADPNNMSACMLKMDWLDPKWYGSREEVLAFGRECLATKNWRAGLTLVSADAYFRVSHQLPADERAKYLASKEVWDAIRSVYEDYLGRVPCDDFRRSQYAAYCDVCGQYAESDKQFKLVGDHLEGNRLIHLDQMEQMRNYVDAVVKAQRPGK